MIKLARYKVLGDRIVEAEDGNLYRRTDVENLLFFLQTWLSEVGDVVDTAIGQCERSVGSEPITDAIEDDMLRLMGEVHEYVEGAH